MKPEGGVEIRGLRLCGVPSERGFVILIFSAGGARVVMPLTGGGVAMGERGGERREKQRYIWLLAADS